MTNRFFAENALLPTGWFANVLLTWNDHGQITQVQPDTACPPQNTATAAVTNSNVRMLNWKMRNRHLRRGIVLLVMAN